MVFKNYILKIHLDLLTFFIMNFLILQSSTIFAEKNIDKSNQPYFDNNQSLNQYLFYTKNNLNGTLIAQNQKNGSKVFNSAKSEQVSDTAENSLTIMYDNEGEPIKLRLRLKDSEPKNKRIIISIYNIIGNKIGDIFEGTQSNYEEFYEENFKEITASLSNGLYLCVVQGLNFRLKMYQKFTISR